MGISVFRAFTHCSQERLQIEHLLPKDTWYVCPSDMAWLYPKDFLSFFFFSPEIFKCLSNACWLPLPQETQSTLQSRDCNDTLQIRCDPVLGRRYPYKSDHPFLLCSTPGSNRVLFTSLCYSSHVYKKKNQGAIFVSWLVPEWYRNETDSDCRRYTYKRWDLGVDFIKSLVWSQ